MQTGKNTIRNLFDGSKIFNVPIYQRAYSWKKEKHLQEFLEDIIGQYPERKYFFGTYLFHIKENEDDFQIIDIIDGQHKTLLKDSNQLITALINRESKEECAKHLDKLIEDIKIHFRDEEKIFLKTKYPYAKNHIISHNNLIKKVEILRNKNYPIPPNLGEVVSFVIYDVVAQHLAIEDKGYFPYISEDIKDANKQ